MGVPHGEISLPGNKFLSGWNKLQNWAYKDQGIQKEVKESIDIVLACLA